MKIFPADTAFSWVIRERDNWTCQRCHTVYVPPTQALHCMHFMGRGKWSTRFVPDNAAAGCYGCHRYLDTHPAEKDAFFRNLLGDVLTDEIVRASNKAAHGVKREMREIAKHYRAELKRMREVRALGHVGQIRVVGYQ